MLFQARKKPVVVGVAYFDGSDQAVRGIVEWSGGKVVLAPTTNPVGTNWLHCATLEGVMRASPGDYIIRGMKGEFYPCKPDIFEATYERVSGNKDAVAAKVGSLS